jgi:hypothetical protein
VSSISGEEPSIGYRAVGPDDDLEDDLEIVTCLAVSDDSSLVFSLKMMTRHPD